METTNRPDEWRIEQGLAGNELPILDQTGPEPRSILPSGPFKPFKDDAAISAVGDPHELFKEELVGWKG